MKNNRFASLSRRADFEQLQSQGRLVNLRPWLAVAVRDNDLKQIRWAWSISRLAGSATVRNRLKRWGKEYLRQNSLPEVNGKDLNFIFRKRQSGFYRSVNREDFNEAMASLLLKLQKRP